ncbi:ribosome biogenesis factor YjgA [Thiobacter aerophilum]|uniref:Dual-action ribosomal maturation protein DarP n=1 Tax=Thiobacter aerophilum TaxID=3121275 RepID=A0ABV0EHB4_9BURK
MPAKATQRYHTLTSSSMDSREDQARFVSKTRRKQDMLALQALGEALTRLPPSHLAKLKLPENLFDAIETAKRLCSREAIRRQMQYIGRLMRQVDPTPIRAQLEAWRSRSAAETAHHHRLEQWRDRLLADDAALERLAAEHPGLELKALRTLIRNARREAQQGKPPRAARALFRALRSQIQAPEAAPNGADRPMDEFY